MVVVVTVHGYIGIVPPPPPPLPGTLVHLLQRVVSGKLILDGLHRLSFPGRFCTDGWVDLDST